MTRSRYLTCSAQFIVVYKTVFFLFCFLTSFLLSALLFSCDLLDTQYRRSIRWLSFEFRWGADDMPSSLNNTVVTWEATEKNLTLKLEEEGDQRVPTLFLHVQLFSVNWFILQTNPILEILDLVFRLGLIHRNESRRCWKPLLYVYGVFVHLCMTWSMWVS